MLRLTELPAALFPFRCFSRFCKYLTVSGRCKSWINRKCAIIVGNSAIVVALAKVS